MVGIELEGLGKNYGRVSAVADLTLTIEPGEFVTLLGPSGSGKTTTMRMIAGLEQPDTGTVRISNRLVSGAGVFVPAHRRRLGMVFQSYAVWPHKTVSQNVAFPLQQQGLPRREQERRCDRILSLVGLAELRDRYPSQLSGGQQQRVALARALVAEPEVILFDEPLSNLDAQLRESMRGLLRDLHREFRITSVYVTHDQVEAMVLSDRVHIMNHGRLVQSGTPEDLYERPGSLFVAEFIGQANVLHVAIADRAERVVRLRGGQPVRVATLPAAAAESILVVRPHRLSFVDGDDPAGHSRAPGSGEASDNVVAGVVGGVTYLGDRVRYAVRLEGEVVITLDLVAGGCRRAVGETVRVRLPADACVVI